MKASRYAWQLIRGYWRWAGARRTWKGRVLAFAVPLLLAPVLLFSTTGSGRTDGSDGPLSFQPVDSGSTSLGPTFAPAPPLGGQSTESPERVEEVQQPKIEVTPIATPAIFVGDQASNGSSPAVEKTWSQGKEVTEASVKAALPDTTSRANDIAGPFIFVPFKIPAPASLVVNKETGTVWLSYPFNIDARESEIVTYGSRAAFNASRALFANPAVQLVTVELESDFVDRFGATASRRSSLITVDRHTADRIDWDGMRSLILRDNKSFYCASNLWYLHQIVYESLKDLGCLLNSQKTRLVQ